MVLEAVQEKIFNNMQKLADEYIEKKNKKKKKIMSIMGEHLE